jgi:predicted helicase
MPSRHPLQDIKSFPSLVKYLRDELDWPIETESFEDLTFDFAPEELGLKPNEAAKVKDIKQLRPLVTNQPWGIFFLNFEPKRLPVVALRKILSNLVFKKRTTTSNAERAAWNLNDLLFISAFGEDNDRQITLAHFSEGAGTQDLPTLRVLGWDELDTQLNLQHVDRQLHDKLRWPSTPNNLDAWRKQWSAAFVLRHRHVITTAQELAERLAVLAQSIRRKVNQVLEIESESGELRKLYAAFRESLIHDLTEDDFADMYAQTITYGLFSAAVSRTTPDAGTVVLAENLVDMVPITNPFLREMLATFLTVGGRKGKLEFDELGIQEVIEVLNSTDTNLNAVVLNFGDRRQGQDPVIHFYEDFLKQYDEQRKVERGVFYTPQPVVSYIVRSVHELLQSEFGLEDGLASTITWGEMVERRPDIQLPTIKVVDSETKGVVNRPIDSTTPFVQILDPATGTATFLVEVIDVIHRTMMEKWKRQRLNSTQMREAWNQYVSAHLLPRLYGYELMMAPYAIAHMKIGLKLSETGYHFLSNERAHVYLANALEPPSPLAANKAASLFEALGHEAQAVNRVKVNQRFTVVIGNPPYSRASSNKSESAERMLEPYKSPVRDEKNIQPLSDDYIKFIRLSELLIGETAVGIHGMITNSTFISGRIHRGIRQSLMETFSQIKIVDLHGSGKVNLLGNRGADDENVFDILQGVSICVMVKQPAGTVNELSFAELVGPRETKYEFMNDNESVPYQRINPVSPYFLWIPRSEIQRTEYDSFQQLDRLFSFVNVSGKPGDDELLVSFDAGEAIPKLHRFRESIGSENPPRLTEAGRNLAALSSKTEFSQSNVLPYAYRPFDTRHIYYDADVWTRPVKKLKATVDGSLILLTTKIVKDPQFAHVFVTRLFPDVIFLSNTSSINCYSFPSNFNNTERMLDGCETQENLDVTPFSTSLSQEVQANDAFRYVYALLHSPTYRSMYYELLQYDFPRIPLTESVELFRALTPLGGELTDLHLLESPRLAQPITEFIGSPKKGATLEVEKISWSRNTVWIDKAKTIGFRGVREPVWNFHIGGYQVCEKWLKDRKGRTLSKDDIAHYHKIVVALSETIRLMSEIDSVINQHGGWPNAFVTEAVSEAKTN